jgi:hypothetical protein
LPESYLYQGEYAQSLLARGQAKGVAKGVANAVVIVLESRGVVLSDADRERVYSCSDLELLFNVWLIRAISVHSAEELFA